MPSFLIPQNIKIAQAPGYIKIEGPFGYSIKKTGGTAFSVINTSEGLRLFANNSTGLSFLFQIVRGLAYGFRQRLRLTGIGFRAYSKNTPMKDLNVKGYIRKRLKENTTSPVISIKLGFSHEITYCSSQQNPVAIAGSRLEGRTKGTLIYLQGNSKSHVHQAASEIQSFRFPDVYKGKGIYFDKQKIKLKKGKRQG